MNIFLMDKDGNLTLSILGALANSEDPDEMQRSDYTET